MPEHLPECRRPPKLYPQSDKSIIDTSSSYFLKKNLKTYCTALVGLEQSHFTPQSNICGPRWLEIGAMVNHEYPEYS